MADVKLLLFYCHPTIPGLKKRSYYKNKKAKPQNVRQTLFKTFAIRINDKKTPVQSRMALGYKHCQPPGNEAYQHKTGNNDKQRNENKHEQP